MAEVETKEKEVTKDVFAIATTNEDYVYALFRCIRKMNHDALKSIENRFLTKILENQVDTYLLIEHVLPDLSYRISDPILRLCESVYYYNFSKLVEYLEQLIDQIRSTFTTRIGDMDSDFNLYCDWCKNFPKLKPNDFTKNPQQINEIDTTHIDPVKAKDLLLKYYDCELTRQSICNTWMRSSRLKFLDVYEIKSLLYWAISGQTLVITCIKMNEKSLLCALERHLEHLKSLPHAKPLFMDT